MDVDEREGESLIGGRPAHAKPGHQRFAVKQVVGVGNGVERRAVGFDDGGVIDESILLFAVGAAQARTDEIVVMAAGRVDQVDETRENIVGLGTHFLDRHDVEWRMTSARTFITAGLSSLAAAEDLDVERGDAKRPARRSAAGGNDSSVPDPACDAVRGWTPMRSRPTIR